MELYHDFNAELTCGSGVPVLGPLLKESIQLLRVGGFLHHSPLNKHHALLVLLDLQFVLKRRAQ